MAQPEETDTTIFKELSTPNPEVKNFSDSFSNSTPSREKLPYYPLPGNTPESLIWTEFNNEYFEDIVGWIIHAPWPKSEAKEFQRPVPTHWRSEFKNEDMLEHQILRDFIMNLIGPCVDRARKIIDAKFGEGYVKAALELKIGEIKPPSKDTDAEGPVMEDTTSQDPTFSIQRHGFGKLDSGHLKPDWVFSCSYNKESPLAYGDSKHGKAFDSSLLNTKDFEAPIWNPVRQVLRYCKESPKKTREYGFVITEKELVVMQVTFDSPSPTKDTIQDPNPGQSSSETQASGSNPGPSSVEESRTNRPQRTNIREKRYAESTVSEDNARPPRPSSSYKSVSNCEIKYRSIPWANHGDKVLTIRLGLFYLFLMSIFGPGPLTGPSGPEGPLASIANRGAGQHTSSSSKSQSSGSGTKTTLGQTEGTDLCSSESTGSGGPSQNTRSKSRHREGQEHQRIDLPVRSAAQ